MIPKPFSAMILAAGYGKRLNPLTVNIPKPLIKINKISLLQNTIDFLFRLNCNKIVINTHYKSDIINDFIKKNYNHKKIILLYEKKILDTAGGVKNALSLFNRQEILVTNSDIFWKEENLTDIVKFIKNYNSHQYCKLLLVPKEKAHGINRDNGDFVLNKGQVKRWNFNEKNYFYSGLQILSLRILNDYSYKKFSFNVIWDDLILKKSLYGSVMNSHWYHVGDKKGLAEAIKSVT
mgnify:CR=1 FL=1